MSKVVFLSLPYYGHIHPSLPLVKEPVVRGEQVIYYSTPKFQEAIAQTGAQYRDYSSQAQSGRDSSSNANAGSALDRFKRLVLKYLS